MFIRFFIVSILTVLAGTLGLASYVMAGDWYVSPLEKDAKTPCLMFFENEYTGESRWSVYRFKEDINYVVSNDLLTGKPTDVPMLTPDGRTLTVRSGTPCSDKIATGDNWNRHVVVDPVTCEQGVSWCVKVDSL